MQNLTQYIQSKIADGTHPEFLGGGAEFEVMKELAKTAGCPKDQLERPASDVVHWAIVSDKLMNLLAQAKKQGKLPEQAAAII